MTKIDEKTALLDVTNLNSVMEKSIWCVYPIAQYGAK